MPACVGIVACDCCGSALRQTDPERCHCEHWRREEFASPNAIASRMIEHPGCPVVIVWRQSHEEDRGAATKPSTSVARAGVVTAGTSAVGAGWLAGFTAAAVAFRRFEMLRACSKIGASASVLSEIVMVMFSLSALRLACRARRCK